MARILLVDDNLEFRGLLSIILIAAEHSVTCASDGNEAIKCFSPEEIDLVITDLLMPNKEGLETIIELRSRQPSLKIIAMTGGSQNASVYLQLADSFGVSRTLVKPFSRSALLEAVTEALLAPQK